MRGDDLFPSKYLKPADLGSARPVVTIRRVDQVQMFGGDSKPVCYFEGREKGFVLNKTNWRAIEALTGQPDSDDWPGARIRLYVTQVPFQGTQVDAIRVMAASAGEGRQAASGAPQRASRPVPGPAMPAVEQAFPVAVQSDEDDIPF